MGEFFLSPRTLTSAWARQKEPVAPEGRRADKRQNSKRCHSQGWLAWRGRRARCGPTRRWRAWAPIELAPEALGHKRGGKKLKIIPPALQAPRTGPRVPVVSGGCRPTGSGGPGAPAVRAPQSAGPPICLLGGDLMILADRDQRRHERARTAKAVRGRISGRQRAAEQLFFGAGRAPRAVRERR